MANTNDFLPVATAGGANVQSQLDYAADPDRTGFFPDGGIPDANQHGKMFRQSSSIASQLAQLVADAGADMLDDGNLATLKANMALLFLQGGQCRLSVVDATHIKLSPYNGRIIIINGQPQFIPSAGVTITNAGLAASTLYYVYAWMNAGVMTLELSVTGHLTDANSGVEIKNGDVTRSLVGMIYTTGASQFVDSNSQRFCANWFNRRSRVGFNTLAGMPSTNSAVNVDIMPANHCEFLAWADAAPNVGFIGSGTNNTAVSSNNTGIGLDGVATILATIQVTAPLNNALVNCSIPAQPVNVTEGYHYVTLAGFAGGNTAIWQNPTILVQPVI